ncbi:MAG: tetratricopeptide repeat protein [Nitrospirae bacterium]|nr:tetratricopeptide repeat protein [Nitrospirota bacterium]
MKFSCLALLLIAALLSVSLSFARQNTQDTFFVQNIDVRQREQGAEVRSSAGHNTEIQQRKQEGLIPQVSQEAEKKRGNQETSGRGLLGKAWNYFNKGNYDKAAEIFAYIQSFPDSRMEADFGVASCYIKQNKVDKALDLLEMLVQEDFRPRDTIPVLMDVLLRLGQIEKAGHFIAMFEGKEKEKWQKRIDGETLKYKYANIKKTGAVDSYIAFIKYNGTEIKQCVMTDIFYDAADFLLKNGSTDEARAIYGALLSCSGDPALRLGILYSLKTLLPPRELLDMAEKEEAASGATADYVKRLSGFKLDVLYGLLQPDSTDLADTAARILKIKPGDPVALSALSWWHFNNARYDEAYNGFLDLHNSYPEKTDYVEGMINSLTKLKRFGEALEIAAKYIDNEKVASLEKDIKLKIIWDKVSALPPDSPELEELAREMLAINPDDKGARNILAWLYYSNDEYEKAYDEFSALYARTPLEEGVAFGLTSTLIKLNRLDDALEIAVKNRQHDDRLVSLETDIYLTKAKAAYADKKYSEAQNYFEKVMAENPDDIDTKERLNLTKYKQTLFGKAMSMIVGLPGYSWGNNLHYLKLYTGNSPSFSVNQGIDWLRLPGDVILNTYGEYRYTNKTNSATYVNTSGQDAGIVFKKSDFKLGAEFSWDKYPDLRKTETSKNVYLTWYYDWYKYMKRRGEESSLNIMEALTGSTYGRINHDFGNVTGTSVSGFINQGIDWFSLPGDITFNTYAEYRFGFRTKDSVYYNSHGPAVGIELQKKPFRLGMDYYWEFNTEQNSSLPGQHATDKKVTVYLKWYYNWDLKPKE